MRDDRIFDAAFIYLFIENAETIIYRLLLLLLLFFDPGTQFPRKEKNYAMQYKKVQKSIHEYYYGGAVALLLQDHLTMSVSRFAG